MTNEELREGYEKNILRYETKQKIMRDIIATASSQKVDEDDPDFLNDFWLYYCPEDDDPFFIRE